MTKLASSLPKALEDDGLASLNRRLIENPEQHHLLVAVVDCKHSTRDTDTGSVEATARVVQVEPIHDEADADAVAEILQRASDKRNGRLALPGIFGPGGPASITVNGRLVDPATGEIKPGT